MATSNRLRALNRLPFDFEDGLKVKGVDISSVGGADLMGYENGPVPGTITTVKKAIRTIEGRNFYVEKYGAKGDGVTDDAVAINAACAAAELAGGGVVHLIAGGVHLCQTQDIIIGNRVVLTGHAISPGEVVHRPRFYTAVPNSIVLHPNYTIKIATTYAAHSAGICRVYICNPLVDTERYAVTYDHANRADLHFKRTDGQDSLAIKVGSDIPNQGNNSCFVKEISVIGYSRLLWANYANGFEYGGIRGDCTNGIKISNITHIVRNSEPCDLFPYVTSGRGNNGKYNWRNGVGFDLDYQGAYADGCFTYGHKIGFRLRRDTVVLSHCWADANPESTIEMETLWGDISHGFLSENGLETTGAGNPAVDHQLIGCGSSSHTMAFTSAIGETGSSGRKLTLNACSAWGSAGKHHLYVESGIVVARNCNFYNNTRSVTEPIIKIGNDVTWYDINDCTFHQPANYIPVSISTAVYEKGDWGRGNKVFNGLGPSTHEAVYESGQDDHSYVVVGTNSGMKLNGKYAGGDIDNKTVAPNNVTLMSTAGFGYTGVTYSLAARHRIAVDDPSPGLTSMGGKHIFSTTGAGSTNLVDRIVIANNGDMFPVINNAYSLGATGARWSSVWGVSGNFNTLKLNSLPTSAAGLTTGDVWNDAGTLKVV